MISAMHGRTAIVTGAASGIGAAVVRRLVAAGCAVHAIDLDAAGLATLVASGIQTHVQDVSDIAGIAKLVQAQGPFDIAVNCAGIDQHEFFTQSEPASWPKLLSVNLEGVLAITHAVLPGMQARGYGRIVNVASEAGRLGSRGGSVYAAAKGGVIAFTRSIARENGLKGITANAVAPGPIDTPMLQAAVNEKGDRLMAAMIDATLVGRLGTADEVAAAVLFLASADAGFITGEVLGVSGGMGCGA